MGSGSPPARDPQPQRYTHLGPGVVRFESEGFSADLAFDDDGIVTDYPGLAKLVGS